MQDEMDGNSFSTDCKPEASRISQLRKCNRSSILSSHPSSFNSCWTRFKLSSLEFSKLSITTTRYRFVFSNSRHVCEPMYPVPPVTRTVRKSSLEESPPPRANSADVDVYGDLHR